MGDGPLPLYLFCFCCAPLGALPFFALSCVFARLEAWREGASWQASGQRLRVFHRVWSHMTSKSASHKDFRT